MGVNSYKEAREKAKRLARALNHYPGRFEPAGYGRKYFYLCKRCHMLIGVYQDSSSPWTPYGKGTTEPCPR